MQGGMYCVRCGRVFPTIDAAWAHYHSWEVPAAAQAIQLRQALAALVGGLPPPAPRGAAE